MMRTKQFLAGVQANYRLVMDPDKNPLWSLPAAQRFQIMTYLSVMWTAIFCAAFGRWYWYGELITAHMLIVLGSGITGVTFAQASRPPSPIPAVRLPPQP